MTVDMLKGVPFGQSTPAMRQAWREDRAADYCAGHRLTYEKVWGAHELAYAYAWGWIDAMRDYRTPEWREQVSELALHFAEEYARQEWLWEHNRVNYKRGYSLWWADVLRMRSL